MAELGSARGMSSSVNFSPGVFVALLAPTCGQVRHRPSRPDNFLLEPLRTNCNLSSMLITHLPFRAFVEFSLEMPGANMAITKYTFTIVTNCIALTALEIAGPYRHRLDLSRNHYKPEIKRNSLCKGLNKIHCRYQALKELAFYLIYFELCCRMHAIPRKSLVRFKVLR